MLVGFKVQVLGFKVWSLDLLRGGGIGRVARVEGLFGLEGLHEF